MITRSCSMRKARKIRVRTEWMRLHPKRKGNLKFWITVGKRIADKGIKKSDVSAIYNIIKEVENEYLFSRR